MKPDPFAIPDDGKIRTINFSGGRTSAYMLRRILDANGGVPANTFPVFANTGLEHPKTLDFVHACETRWGIDIAWLEYDYRASAKGGIKEPKNHYRIVGHETASRDGGPYQALIDRGNNLPSVRRRICTKQLKVEVVGYYVRRHLGFKKKPYAVLGIRADEPKRWGKALFEKCHTEYPLVHADTTKADVLRFWRESDFDLGLPESGIFGNCVGCFLKSANMLAEIAKQDKGWLEWWRRNEKRMSQRDWIRKQEYNQFNQKRSYDDILALAEARGGRGNCPLARRKLIAFAGIE